MWVPTDAFLSMWVSPTFRLMRPTQSRTVAIETIKAIETIEEASRKQFVLASCFDARVVVYQHLPQDGDWTDVRLHPPKMIGYQDCESGNT